MRPQLNLALLDFSHLQQQQIIQIIGQRIKQKKKNIIRFSIPVTV